MTLLFRSARTVRASSSGLSSTSMITSFFKGHFLANRSNQCEVKNCTAIDCAFGPNASSMPVHDALHRGQADPTVHGAGTNLRRTTTVYSAQNRDLRHRTTRFNTYSRSGRRFHPLLPGGAFCVRGAL